MAHLSLIFRRGGASVSPAFRSHLQLLIEAKCNGSHVFAVVNTNYHRRFSICAAATSLSPPVIATKVAAFRQRYWRSSLCAFGSCKNRSSPNSLSPSADGSLSVVATSANYSSRIFSTLTMATYGVLEKGCPNTTDYRLYITDEQGPISALHDIPLVADAARKTYNMVVEVPRWTNAKMEITLKETLNPIKQDVKKGKLRYVANCFPHHGYIWNYGALPQTWENPAHLDDGTGCKGDNDPIDVLEIGYRVARRGDVVQVKVLGTIALIDEGETDWKLIAIDVNDPLAAELNDIGDVDKHLPGLLKASLEWFRIYKIPDGKPENKFAFNGEAKSAAFAQNVIDQTHGFWKSLVSGEADANGISCANTTVPGNSFKISSVDAKEVTQKVPPSGPAGPIEPIVDKWHHVQLK